MESLAYTVVMRWPKGSTNGSTSKRPHHSSGPRSEARSVMGWVDDAERYQSSGGRIEAWCGSLTLQLPFSGGQPIGTVLGQGVLDGKRHREEDVHRIQDEDSWGNAALVDPGI